MSKARYTKTENELGQTVYISYKVWHRESGFKSFATLDKAEQYADEYGHPRIDEIKQTIIIEK